MSQRPAVVGLLILAGIAAAETEPPESDASAPPLTRPATATVSQAETEYERTTVYATATVEARPIASATASVTILDRESIESTGVGSVAELLSFVPGVVLESNGTRGGLTMARIRGGDPNFTLMLVDGVAVNDPTYQTGGVFNLEALPVSSIERIEVVRGPLSSFYGSTGLAGAIHVITRHGGRDEPRFDIGLGVGDANWDRLTANIGATAGGTDYFVSVSHESEAQRVADERFELTHLQGRLGLDLGAHSRLELTSRVAVWDGDDYPEASGGPVLGSGELRLAENDEISLGAELVHRAPGGSRHKVTAAFYRHQLDRTSPAIFSPFVQGVPLVPESSEATRYTRSRLGWALSLEPTDTTQMSVGVDVEREDGENTSVLLLPPFLGGEVAGDYRLRRTTPGAFTELLLERGQAVFEIGLRVDVPQDSSTRLSPRLGASYRLDDATRLRASAGRAFKLPSFFALASPPQLGGNPGLRPEVATGGDLGIERDFTAGRARVSLTLFFNRFEELVDFDFDLFTHLNRSAVEAKGVEAGAGWRPSRRWRLDAQVTWQEVDDLNSDTPLRHRPEWAGSLRLAWRPRPKLDLALDGRFSATAFDEQIPVPERSSFAGSELWGLRVAWSATARWRLEARVDNLTDQDYETMIGFPGPRRSVKLGLRYQGTGRSSGRGHGHTL